MSFPPLNSRPSSDPLRDPETSGEELSSEASPDHLNSVDQNKDENTGQNAAQNIGPAELDSLDLSSAIESTNEKSVLDTLEFLIKKWPFEEDEMAARLVKGADGRELIQLRIELGVLQLEVKGRPDGERPSGFPTYYDLIVANLFELGDSFDLTENHCREIDREFAQFYHRRIAWLALRDFDKAMDDADHTLSLMDFSSANSANHNWIEQHEQYRPFVVFHKVQADTLGRLADSQPQNALLVLDLGLSQLQRSIDEIDLYVVDEHASLSDLSRNEFRTNHTEFVYRLKELRRTIMMEYDLGPSLADQLADAIAFERFELAAKLRDRIAKKQIESLPVRAFDDR